MNSATLSPTSRQCWVKPWLQLVISKPSLAEKIPRTLKFRNPKKRKNGKLQLFEQSRKLQVHKKHIHKFGKVPSFTARLHKNQVWQTSGASLKGYLRTCTVMTQSSKEVLLFGKVPSVTSCFYNFQKPMSVP